MKDPIEEALNKAADKYLEREAKKEAKRKARDAKRKASAKNFDPNNKKIDNFDEIIDITKQTTSRLDRGMRNFWSDFKKFIAKGNIFDLAIAVIIGTAFNKIVSALVANIITPLVSLLLPSDSLSELMWTIPAHAPLNKEPVDVTYGVFLEAIIDFLVIALSVFVAMRVFIRIKNTFMWAERVRELAEKKKAAIEEAKLAEENAKIEAERIAEEERVRAETERREAEEKAAAEAREKAKGEALEKFYKNTEEQTKVLADIKKLISDLSDKK